VLFAIVLWPSGTRLSYHGTLHAGFVAQIAAGLVPPENPALAGEPLGFYWLFHWLLAVYSGLSGFSILVTAPILNGVSLLLYLGASYRLLGRFLSGSSLALAILAAGFAGNWFFPVLWIARVALEGSLQPFVWPFQLLSLGSLGGDPRLVTLLAKFLNQGGFALGLGLWAVLVERLAPREEEPPWRAVFLLLCSLVAFHTTTALAALAAAAPAVAAGAIGGTRRDFPRLLRAAAAFAAAVVVSAPYLWSITIGAHTVAGPLFSSAEELRYNFAGVAGSATPLLLLAALAAVPAWRGNFERVLWLTTALLILAGAVIHLPDANQYTLTLLAAFPGGVLLVRWCRHSPTLLAVVVAVALAGHALTAGAYLASPTSRRASYRGDGAYLAVADDADLDRALRWIRTDTEPDAVVIGWPVRFGTSPIRPATGRSEFALLGGHHTRGNPVSERRLALLAQLFSVRSETDPVLRAISGEIERPLYLMLTRKRFPDTFELLTARFDSSRLLVDGVRGDDVVVYRVGPR
jgi:hypothetical protein